MGTTCKLKYFSTWNNLWAGNLKFELSIKGEAARGGKAPQPFYHKLMDDVGVKFRNVWQQ